MGRGKRGEKEGEKSMGRWVMKGESRGNGNHKYLLHVTKYIIAVALGGYFCMVMLNI